MLNTFVTKQANVIFGSAISESMGDEVRVTVVATGLDRPFEPADAAAAAAGSAPDVLTGLPAGAVPTVGQTTYAAPTLGGASSETSGADDAPAAAPAAPAPQAAASADAEPVTIPSAGGYAIPTYLRSSGS